MSVYRKGKKIMYGDKTENVLDELRDHLKTMQRLDSDIFEEMAETQVLLLKTVADLIVENDSLRSQVKKLQANYKELETRVDGLDPAPAYKKDEKYVTGEKPQPKHYSFKV